MPIISADAFWRLAQQEIRATLSLCQFKAHFGAPPEVVAEVWDRIQPPPEGSWAGHLLWMFAFVKMYETENTAASRFGTTKKTWHKWVWIMLAEVQEIMPTVASSFSRVSK